MKFRNLFYVYISLITILFNTSQFLLSQTTDTPITVNKENIREHTYQLGSDHYQGRGTGTEGESEAAKYITNFLHEYGILPIGERMSYYQNIPMHGSYPQKSSRFIIQVNNSDQVLKLGEDYLLYKTGAETYIPNPIPLVFVGYGIIAPEFDYNDYLSVDVQGKVVVFLSGEPYSEDEFFFKGTRPTIYSYPEAKQRIAISRGARGSIMIPVSEVGSRSDWEHWVKEFAFEHVTLAYTVSSHMSALINPAITNKIFYGSQYSYDNVLAMHNEGILSSFELQSRISFDGKFDERDFIGRNLIGMVEGRDNDLKDTYIILSAHYDHLGIGPEVKGDSIYNGVMDNALGVAALLEISRLFAELQSKPKKSVIFLFLTGEEKGLLGSKYYIDHPSRPLYKTIANINIDGLAAFDEFKDIIGVGAELSSLENDLINVAQSFGLEVSSIPDDYFYESESISRSDQFSFMKAGIPSILLTEGLNYKNTTYQQGLDRLIQWTETVYHTPFDDLNQNLNFDAAQQHTRLIFKFSLLLANKTDPPQWNPGSPYINARLQSIAEKR
jgi:hypothetical protein